MFKQAYEAGVKQALVDSLTSMPGSVGSSAIKPTPPPPQPIASPPSPTMVAGNTISPAATMTPKPTATGETQAYGEGAKQAMTAPQLAPKSSALRPKGITQPTGGDLGLGGSGLGKNLLSTGGGGSLGKLAVDAKLLLDAARIGGGAGGTLGVAFPKTVRDGPIWENPVKRITLGGMKGALYGAGAGLGLGTAALGGEKLLELLRRAPK